LKPQSRTPTQKEINDLKGYAEEYISDADGDKNVLDHGEDNKEYIFEKVMEMFYDKDIWKKVNTRVETGIWP
jgi:hypothetical protein